MINGKYHWPENKLWALNIQSMINQWLSLFEGFEGAWMWEYKNYLKINYVLIILQMSSQKSLLISEIWNFSSQGKGLTKKFVYTDLLTKYLVSPKYVISITMISMKYFQNYYVLCWVQHMNGSCRVPIFCREDICKIIKAFKGWEFTNESIFNSCARKWYNIRILEFVCVAMFHRDVDCDQ